MPNGNKLDLDAAKRAIYEMKIERSGNSKEINIKSFKCINCKCSSKFLNSNRNKKRANSKLTNK